MHEVCLQSFETFSRGTFIYFKIYKTLISIKIEYPDFTASIVAHTSFPEDPMELIQNQGVQDLYHILIPLLNILNRDSSSL